ncbi:site-specific integrase [uncultured Algoriphagus sp.]|uniref:tyrosine-type recombinase/integrase n=1 Tax=uncultured Algoriphagus sp. TaxID=417365 RepID=UPI0030EBC552|tara:strand:- start:25964 stop:27253 length:1290 start_codon:yes stop_codon:yes gene_type:complete
MTRRLENAKDPVEISLYLDTRRAKQNGLYPVKIRVYDGNTKKVKLYSTDYDLDENLFEKVIFPVKGQRLKDVEKAIKGELDDLLYFYTGKVQKIQYFTFDALDNVLTSKTGDITDVFFQYEAYINDLRDFKRVSTASSYQLSMQSLKSYLKFKTGKEVNKLRFHEITVKFLNNYELWMVENRGRTHTTVGIYLRGLRVIFNRAIDLKVITSELYPFGAKKYDIPSSANKKKALNGEQLSRLFHSKPETAEQAKARDFWFFSFACNGMNMKDILHLKWNNIDGEYIEFIREKTKRTKKKNSKIIQVPITSFTRSVIEKYGDQKGGSSSFIFPVLNESMSAERQHLVKMNFIRFVNQHLKRLAEANDLPQEISTYWARHSFATSAIRNDASMEFVSESLGHSDVKTTQRYFAGFEDKTKKDILSKITAFMD